MDYDKLAKAIYDITGPAANIEKAYNCMTRLRLTVKDEHFTKEDLAKLPGVMGINKSGDEWQIVVGPGKATKLYQAFAPLVEGGSKENPAPSARPDSNDDSQGPFDGQALHEEIRRKNATPAKLALKKIAHIFVPIIPAFIACGLITGLLNVAFKMDHPWRPSRSCRSWPLPATPPSMPEHLRRHQRGQGIWRLAHAGRRHGGHPQPPQPGSDQSFRRSPGPWPGRHHRRSPGRLLLVVAGKETPPHRTGYARPLRHAVSSRRHFDFCRPLPLPAVGGYLSEAIGYAATESIGTGGAVTGFILGGTFLPMVMVGIHQA